MTTKKHNTRSRRASWQERDPQFKSESRRYDEPIPSRALIVAELGAAGIGAGVHYPVPLHLTGAYAGLGRRRGSFPVAERAAEEILSLPLHPHITWDQQEYVVDVLSRAAGRSTT